jgi:hypothetical protein
MSGPVQWDSRIDAELAEWPGVEARREHASKHMRLVLSYGGKERFVIYPSTPSDHRGQLNKIRDIRKELTALGATRNERRKAKVRRTRNRTQREILAHIQTAPVKANPFDALAAIQFSPEPVPEPGLMARMMAALRRLFA